MKKESNRKVEICTSNIALVIETARLLNRLMSGSDGSSADNTATALCNKCDE